MSFTIETPRLILQTSDVSLAPKLLNYYSKNRSFFEKYEPANDDDYYTLSYQTNVLEHEVANMERGISAYYYFFLKENPDHIIGSMSFVRFRGEPYANTIFGYDLDEEHQGHGYCTEACKAAIENVKTYHNVHRFEARVQVDNKKSIKLLERLDFWYEGIERKSILLQGEFKDHFRYALLNDDYVISSEK